MSSAHRGFILQPSYRIENVRPVVHLYGVLESGGSFLVRDDRAVPAFWIRERDAGAADRLGVRSEKEVPPRRTMRGEPVGRVTVPTPPDTPAVRDRLLQAGIPCYEADVRFAYRYLIDRGIRGAIQITGTPQRDRDGFAAVFDNPEVGPGDWSPALTVLSFDIETDPTGRRLLSIALCGRGAEEVFLVPPPSGKTVDDPRATVCRTEREVIERFRDRVLALDPDVLTGWNVIGFDLTTLARIARRTGVPLGLGRGAADGEGVRLRPSPGPRGGTQASIRGRVVLDGIDLMRGAFIRMESFALDAVAREVLGVGKTISGSDRAEEILRLHRESPDRFIEYNLTDARLVLEILAKLRLVELAVQRSRLTGMPPDRVGASIASFDFLYLSELSRRRIVAPSVGATEASTGETSGGHVLEPEPGLHRNVLVLDFKSLYPSIIRTFQIDPLGLLEEPSRDKDAIRAPNGAAFRREPGILPGLLDDLFPRREAARQAGDRVASQAIKILMNSFYGVLGTSACRFARPELANAITGFGREILLWTEARIRESGYRVLYGDTDSLFIESRVDVTDARHLGVTLAERLTRDLAAHVSRTWRVESRLELAFERLYLRLLLPAVRHGTTGARKRYAGLMQEEDGTTRVVFRGLEAVRRDWTTLAKNVQRELYERLFTDRPVESYLQAVVASVRAGEHDELLVYRKSLRKPLASYTASTPPHVAAARKMSRRPGWVVRYVMTLDGPEPADERRSPLDHEHYVQKQIRPIAETVLGLLGLDFDRLVGDDRQMDLF